MSLPQDLRLGLRRLLSAPGYSVMIALFLTCGLAPVILVGALLDALVVRPLPFPEQQELVRVYHHRLSDGDQGPFSPQQLRDVAATLEPHVYQRLAAFEQVDVTLAPDDGDGAPIRRSAALASAGFFDVFGVRPAVGRFFVPGEDLPRAPRVVVLSDQIWQSRFERSPAAIGTTLLIDAQPHRIVGVVPRGLELLPEIELWIPFNERVHAVGRFNRNLEVVARLADGVTPAQATERGQALADLLSERHAQAAFELLAVPLLSSLTGELERPLQTLLVLMALVLVAVCSNITILAGARWVEREGEMALRAALGADPGRLARQVSAESTLLTVAGLLPAVLIAGGACLLINAVVPILLPDYLKPRIEWRWLPALFVLAAAVHVAVATVPKAAVRIVGSAPRPGVGRRVTAERGRLRLRRLFLQVQAALAFVLLTAAAYLALDARQMARIDPGLDVDDVIAARVALPLARYPAAHQIELYLEELRRRALELPGVGNVAFSSRLPIAGRDSKTSFRFAGNGSFEKDAMPIQYAVVTSGYAEALDLPLLAGRAIDERDSLGAPQAVMVNRTFVERFGGGATVEEMVGDRIEIAINQSQSSIIVGVFADARHDGLGAPPPPFILLAQAQFPWRDLVMLAELDATGADESDFAQTLSRLASQLDPTVPIFDIEPLRSGLDDDRFLSHLVFGLIFSLSLLLLALVCFGLYAASTWTIRRHRRSLGIRVALGASPDGLRRRLIAQTATQLAAALGVGLVLCFALRVPLESLAGSTPPSLALACGLAAAAVALASSLALWLASRQLARLDPATELRAP